MNFTNDLVELLQYKVALKHLEIAEYYIEKGGFKNIKKGLKHFKYSVWVCPPSEELKQFGERMREEIDKIKK